VAFTVTEQQVNPDSRETLPVNSGPPSGTVVFLFTDIERSTTLWQEDSDKMRVLLREHDALTRDVVARHEGYVFKMVGDGCCTAFAQASDAVASAVALQRALSSAPWNKGGYLSVRMAIHAGSFEARDDDFFGPPLNRVSRLLNVAHGGQILVSAAARELLLDATPLGASLHTLGTHRLRDLSSPETIHQVAATGLRGEFPALNTLDPAHTNLPVQLTSFVGRDRELAVVGALLRETDIRLLTLTGPGGTGKSRLALHAAAELTSAFRHGVYLCELAPVTDAAQFMTAVRASISLPEGDPGELETIVRWAAGNPALLILDNLEHLVNAAPQLPTLLRRCERLKILITSRIALRVPGEHVYQVPAFDVPTDGAGTAAAVAGNESVRLFIARARAADTNFVLIDDNAGAIAGICARLEGLPLAIELAAARTRTLPPQAILQRLNNTRGGSLSLLSGGAGESRHQTLHSAIDWSYSLLDAGSRETLCDLSVFRNGWTLDAAESICGAPNRDVLASIDSLLEASLITRDGKGSRPRYRMLETIREFADVQLTPEGRDAIGHLHAGYFLEWAERTDSREGSSNEKQAAFAELFEDQDNGELAISELLRTGRRAEAGRLVGLMAELWLERCDFSHGTRWLQRVLPAPGDEQESDALALYQAGVFALHRQDFDGAHDVLERALPLAETTDQSLYSDTLRRIGTAYYRRGQQQEAGDFYARAGAVAERAGDKLRETQAANNVSMLLLDAGDLEEAVSVYRRIADTLVEIGEFGAAAISIGNMAYGLAYLGRDDERTEAFLEAAKLLEGSKREDLQAFTRIGAGDCGTGTAVSPDMARQRLLEAHKLLVRTGDREGADFLLEHVAILMHVTGRHYECAMLWGSAGGMRAEWGLVRGQRQINYYAAREAGNRASIDPQTWDDGWNAGRALSFEKALTYAGQCLESPS
jgi:predicted ATPase/class 3 adenylate cyclase